MERGQKGVSSQLVTLDGSVAEFVGKELKMAAWGPRGDYEFFALTIACNGILRASTRPGTLPEPGGMQSLQSMDGSALGLHSCRALSSEPSRKIARCG